MEKKIDDILRNMAAFSRSKFPEWCEDFVIWPFVNGCHVVAKENETCQFRKDGGHRWQGGFVQSEQGETSDGWVGLFEAPWLTIVEIQPYNNNMVFVPISFAIIVWCMTFQLRTLEDARDFMTMMVTKTSENRQQLAAAQLNMAVWKSLQVYGY